MFICIVGQPPTQLGQAVYLDLEKEKGVLDLYSGCEFLPWAAFEAKELATLSDKKLTGIELANQGLTGKTVCPD